MKQWRIGELAKATGLTVRALHHYDELGLVRPSGRTRSGYRLYDAGDLARLQRVVSLRQLGFTLDAIRDCLDQPGFSAVRIVEMHLERARRQLAEADELVRRLESLSAHLRTRGDASTEVLVQTIEAITMYEKYYTPEQLEALRDRAEQVGPERIREVEQEWPRLIAELRVELDRGTDPTDPRVLDLARRWSALVAEFTGGDPGIARSVSNLYQGKPEIRQRTGLDPALFEYIGRAQAALA